jgi:hypothetical protein
MSQPYGGGVVGGDFLSAPRLNRMLWHFLTGNEMVTYSPKYDGMAVWCTQSGSGFTRGFVYNWDNSIGQYRASSGGKHKHDADDESAGGLFSEVIRANMNKVRDIDLTTPSAGQFTTDSSGGNVTNDVNGGFVTITSGGSAGNYAHVYRSGLAFDLTKPIDLIFKGYVDQRTQISTRIGVCGEHVNASHNDNSKFGIEACDSANVQKNWDIFSATGALSQRGITPTSANVQQSNPQFYKLLLTPGQTVGFFVNSGTTPSFTRSGTVPGSGRTSHIGVFSAGSKTNTGTARIMRLYAARVVGSLSDANWF